MTAGRNEKKLKREKKGKLIGKTKEWQLKRERVKENEVKWSKERNGRTREEGKKLRKYEDNK